MKLSKCYSIAFFMYRSYVIVINKAHFNTSLGIYITSHYGQQMILLNESLTFVDNDWFLFCCLIMRNPDAA